MPSDQPQLDPNTVPPAAGWRRALAHWQLYAILGGALVITAGLVLMQSRSSSGTPANQTASESNSSSDAGANRGTFQRFPTTVQADRDGDGLSDETERAKGTNPALADTDGDELSDAEEVNVYQTNPIRQDTDGDGFPDGQEVRTGNSPTGPGKLRDLPNAIQSLTNTHSTQTNTK